MSIGLCSWSAAAVAQTATPLDRYEPSPAGDEMASVPNANSLPGVNIAAEARVSVAGSPLVVQNEDGTQVVNHQILLHGLVRASVNRWLSFDLNVPVMLNQGGDTTEDVPSLPPPESASLADLRLASQLHFLQQEGAIPGASFRFSAWLPTGNQQEFSGASTVRFEPSVVVGADMSQGVWGVSLGRRFALGDSSDSLIADELLARIGGGPRFGRFLLTGELMATFQNEYDSDHIFDHFPHMEAMAHAKVDLGMLFVRGGGGLGIGEAIGTPSYRFILGVGLAVPIMEASQPGAETQSRPAEVVQALPVQQSQKARPDAGTKGAAVAVVGKPPAQGDCATASANTPAGEGCPSDTDKDGIFDEEDACVEEAGSAHPDSSLHGCPRDSDEDGIIDPVDACPTEPGTESDEADKNGCPKSVVIQGTQIVILQKIDFALSSDKIDESSYGLLQEIVDVLVSHPEIELISVEGHTDSRGSLAKNMALSRRRALSVMRWLIEHGVDERRLQSAGYGPKQPIETNRTKEGRGKNRRVEFTIVNQTGAEASEHE